LRRSARVAVSVAHAPTSALRLKKRRPPRSFSLRSRRKWCASCVPVAIQMCAAFASRVCRFAAMLRALLRHLCAVVKFSKHFRIGELALDTRMGRCSLARTVNEVCRCRCQSWSRVFGSSMPTVRKAGAPPFGATLGAWRFRFALRCVAFSPRCLSQRSWRRVGVASRGASTVASRAFFIT